MIAKKLAIQLCIVYLTFLARNIMDNEDLLHALKDAALEITNVSARVSHLEKQLKKTDAIEKSGALRWCVHQINHLVKTRPDLGYLEDGIQTISDQLRSLRIKLGMEQEQSYVCSLCEGRGVLEEIYLCPKCDGHDRYGSHIN